MMSDHSPLIAVFIALALPVLVLYALIFIGFDRRAIPQRLRPLVSVRDAAVATVALDFAAIIDHVRLGFSQPLSQVTLGVILLFVTLAHIVVLHVFARRPTESSSRPEQAREPVLEALEMLESRSPSRFVVRLASLYVATVMLMTNGTTLLAVLALVRSGL